MSYTPREGSKAAMAVAALAGLGDGESLSTSELADIIGTTIGNTSGNLATAVKHGLIAFHRTAGGKTQWTLGTGEPQPAAESDATDSEDPNAPQFNCARWADGDVCLTGVFVDDNGSVLLSPPHVVQLLALLNEPWRAPAPTPKAGA